MGCDTNQQDKTIFRGQTATFVITVEDENGDRFNLDTHTLHFHVKNLVTDADPPIIDLSTGVGITHRSQVSPNVGVADIVMTSVQTALLIAQDNVFDSWLEKAGGDQSPIIPVSRLTVLTPVSTP